MNSIDYSKKFQKMAKNNKTAIIVASWMRPRVEALILEKIEEREQQVQSEKLKRENKRLTFSKEETESCRRHLMFSFHNVYS